MKLELKHLAPYLPYGLKIKSGNSVFRELTEFSKYYNKPSKFTYIDNVIIGVGHKPILRPLYDLTKEIEINGKKLVPIKELLRSSFFAVDRMSNEEIFKYEFSLIFDVSLEHAEMLYSWHFDLKGLIDKGLAIDINTLK